ncbi:Hypothetical_protein [Hexamita inflata]|uniref:Hypothetical_protein n=1 Tax=Hexamita inflata TaxID=28002 RepID=A0AA86TZG3_9EUKA|nr:Hypothetical protein HINF_LOCUS21955 [Hexamita inflata]CAI9934316.1 Hypothetical protein HINF_LOCUS21961 [Hexamita inflata]
MQILISDAEQVTVFIYRSESPSNDGILQHVCRGTCYELRQLLVMRVEMGFRMLSEDNIEVNHISLKLIAKSFSFKYYNYIGQQCQFKCRTSLGRLRRLFKVTILEDDV